MSFEPGIVLPSSIATPLELGALQRELFNIDEYLTSIRGALPTASPELQEIVKIARVNLLKASDRTQLSNRLNYVRRTAPSVQISFASQPSKLALAKLVDWFRQNGHPNTLITVGVQPDIAGGCVVKTTTKTFDFSIEKLLKSNVSTLATKFN